MSLGALERALNEVRRQRHAIGWERSESLLMVILAELERHTGRRVRIPTDRRILPRVGKLHDAALRVARDVQHAKGLDGSRPILADAAGFLNREIDRLLESR